MVLRAGAQMGARSAHPGAARFAALGPAIADLRGRAYGQVGEGVAGLTSEGPVVRTQLRPPERPGQETGLGLSGRISRSSDRQLTGVLDV